MTIVVSEGSLNKEQRSSTGFSNVIELWRYRARKWKFQNDYGISEMEIRKIIEYLEWKHKNTVMEYL